MKSSLVRDDGHGEAINKGLCPVQPRRVASINRAISFFIRPLQLATWLALKMLLIPPTRRCDNDNDTGPELLEDKTRQVRDTIFHFLVPYPYKY